MFSFVKFSVAKIMQASGKKACFQFPERSLSVANIVTKNENGISIPAFYDNFTVSAASFLEQFRKLLFVERGVHVAAVYVAQAARSVVEAVGWCAGAVIVVFKYVLPLLQRKPVVLSI